MLLEAIPNANVGELRTETGFAMQLGPWTSVQLALPKVAADERLDPN